MDIPLQHLAFTTRKLHVRTAGFWRGPKVLVDGSLVDGKRGTYEIPDDSGTPRKLKVKYSMFDPVPGVDIDGETVPLARPLAWYEYAWMGVPIVLVIAGGALGAVFGLGAVYSSARIFRSDRSAVSKYLLSGLISVGAVVTFLFLATVFHILVYGVPKE